MLDKKGVAHSSSMETSVTVCSECKTSLLKDEIPRYALANKLYRGELPIQFKDLTWVEEMVCALYRNI